MVVTPLSDETLEWHGIYCVRQVDPGVPVIEVRWRDPRLPDFPDSGFDGLFNGDFHLVQTLDLVHQPRVDRFEEDAYGWVRMSYESVPRAMISAGNPYEIIWSTKVQSIPVEPREMSALRGTAYRYYAKPVPI